MIPVKICGIRRRDDIEAANKLMPAYIGFIFAASRRRIAPGQAAVLRDGLEKGIGAVGVFVNAPEDEVAAAAKDCRLSAVQLHGTENAEYVKALRDDLPRGCEIWKAAGVRNAGDITAAQKTGADRLLLDTYSPTAHGGTGHSFDWSVIKKGVIRCPFFIAGGLNARNVQAAVTAAKKAGMPFGIDVSGGVETDGFKDYRKMAEFMGIVRALENDAAGDRL